MNAKGFTLMEMIIYVALFALLLGGVLPTAYQLLRGSENDVRAAAEQEEAAFIDRKLSWAISESYEVTAPAPDTLTVVRIDDAGNPLSFTVSGTAMTIAHGDEAAVPLNAGEFAITDAVFEVHPSDGATSGVATAQFDLDGMPFLFHYSLPEGGYLPDSCAP
jgi:type II secretory pathway pseudopilin PulG